MISFTDLPVRWRTEAVTLRRRGAGVQAAVLEGCAEELEHELRGPRDELLTIEKAAIESGYSEESLRRMVRDGKLPSERSIGHRSRIKIRRRDVPRKPREKSGYSRNPRKEYDPEEDARDIAKRLAR